MIRISYVLGGERAYRDKAKKILLAALTMMAKEYIAAMPGAISPLKLRYKEEDAGKDEWHDAASIQTNPEVDCEEICSYVCGWLQAKRGIQAWPQLVDYNGSSHIVVELPDGSQFDPTINLGRDPDFWHECTSHGKNDPEEKIDFMTDIFRTQDAFNAKGERIKSDDDPSPLVQKTLQIMLHALFLIDCVWLQMHPETPDLYKSGVRYEYEPEGREDWQDWPTTLARKNGDCEDLASLRASELLVKYKERAYPVFSWRTRSNGANLYHILTARGDGRTEDPSAALGMNDIR